MATKDEVVDVMVDADELMSDEFKAADPNVPQANEPESVPEEKPVEPEEKPVEAEPTEEAEISGGEKDHTVPLHVLLEERDKRSALKEQFEALQQHLQMAEQQRQQELAAQQQQQEAPDIFENPEVYQSLPTQMQQLAQQLQQQQQHLALQRMEIMGDISLREAKREDPETFNKAWDSLVQRTQGGDQSWRQQLIQSQDPGKTLVELYKRENAYNETGGDPASYREKLVEELKNDPEFRQQILEAAGMAVNTEPRINMPSLTRAGGQGAAPKASAGHLIDPAELMADEWAKQ